MHRATLGILRCPYCGGHLELVTSLYHRHDRDEIRDGILGCHCCTFPIVDGIPVLHLRPESTAARGHIEAERADLALRAMFGVDSDVDFARFEAIASSGTATYRDTIDALGPSLEGRYFLYRFTDPSFVVAHQVVRAVAGTVLRDGGRAIDVCGGSGHLTRSLMDLSPHPPVLADLFFVKMWLARRFTAPGCEPVCCDGNAPLPFARGAFRYAMCADAFMYLWTKRLFVLEMLRLIDQDEAPGAVVITHAHNQRVWSASHGDPLSPEAYRDLFERVDAHLFAEGTLFEDVVSGGPLDLSRREGLETLNRDPALIMIASRDERVFTRHDIQSASGASGELRLNPLYIATAAGPRVRLTLQFPSADYEDEFGACRRYLPDELIIDPGTLSAVERGDVTPEVDALLRRHVVLDLPKRYY